MAHLWKVLIESGEWTPVLLDGPAFTLDGGEPQQVPDLATTRHSSVALRRLDDQPAALWALVARHDAQVRINGTPARLGLTILADRDEIRTADRPPLFFSTETLAQVELFPPSGTRGFCPRCKQHIDPGTPAVHCPQCGLWHHASDDLPCWTYGPHCALCPQPTNLDAGFAWTPEES